MAKIKTTDKSHICISQSCRKRFTVDFKKNETIKNIRCPNCGTFNMVTSKKNKKQ